MSAPVKTVYVSQYPNPNSGDEEWAVLIGGMTDAGFRPRPDRTAAFARAIEVAGELRGRGHTVYVRKWNGFTATETATDL